MSRACESASVCPPRGDVPLSERGTAATELSTVSSTCVQQSRLASDARLRLLRYTYCLVSLSWSLACVYRLLRFRRLVYRLAAAAGGVVSGSGSGSAAVF